jgi:hypothetical protein
MFRIGNWLVRRNVRGSVVTRDDQLGVGDVDGDGLAGVDPAHRYGLGNRGAVSVRVSSARRSCGDRRPVGSLPLLTLSYRWSPAALGSQIRMSTTRCGTTITDVVGPIDE